MYEDGKNTLNSSFMCKNGVNTYIKIYSVGCKGLQKVGHPCKNHGLNRGKEYFLFWSQHKKQYCTSLDVTLRVYFVFQY